MKLNRKDANEGDARSRSPVEQKGTAVVNDLAGSVLDRIPSDSKEKEIIEALCQELQGAIDLRERAVAELDRMHAGQQKEVDSLVQEMESLVRYRDQALAEVQAANETHRHELAALRAAGGERDALLRKIEEAEESHRQQLDALRDQTDPAQAAAIEELARAKKDQPQRAGDEA